MNAIELLRKHYRGNSELYNLLYNHGRSVADKCLIIAKNKPKLQLDISFVEEAALLHDIGIKFTHAPSIHCHGTYPYICHGYLGAELLREEGYSAHSLVAERHTGTGITLEQIIERELPLPKRDMSPVTMEEKLICFADKFYSKKRLNQEKSIDQVKKSLSKFGEEQIKIFEEWCELFL